MQLSFDSLVTLWDARPGESWFLATMPEELSAELKELPAPRRGFGSLRVLARIGISQWRTSIFPGSEGYVLPLKRAVRVAEKIAVGDVIQIELDILDL